MKISLATPEKLIFSGESNDVLVNADKGQLNILDRHANLITLVKKGVVSLKDATSAKPELTGNLKFEVGEGVLKVEDNKLSILCGEIAQAK